MANIQEILREKGYEIVSHIKMQSFRLKLTKEGLQNKKESLKEGGFFDYNLEGEFNVEISEMGFNEEDGGLYIILTCTGDEHFEKGDTFEVIEYDEYGNLITFEP